MHYSSHGCFYLTHSVYYLNTSSLQSGPEAEFQKSIVQMVCVCVSTVVVMR